MNTVFKLITAAVMAVLFIPADLHADDGLNGSTGLKMIIAKDEKVNQNYYKTFAGAGWNSPMFEIKAVYYRWFSYAISDELLNTKEININQPEIGISLIPSEMIDVDLSCSCYSGDSSFKAYRFAGGLALNFDKFDFSSEYSYRKDEYDFNGTIEKKIQGINSEIGININESVTWDISYWNERIDYSTYGYIYKKHSVRTGFLYILSRKFFILWGIAGSFDTSDVVSGMIDAGFTLKIYDHIKLGAVYIYTEEFSKKSSSGTGPGSKSESSIETQSVHTGSFSVTLYF